MGERLIVEADVKNLARIRNFVEEWAASLQADSTSVSGLVLAVDESATNIILHGYQGQPGLVEILLDQEEDEMVVRLMDHAQLFDPTKIPPPDLSLPIELRVDGGLGIYLARNFVDSYSYRVASDGRNELTLRKKLR